MAQVTSCEVWLYDAHSTSHKNFNVNRIARRWPQGLRSGGRCQRFCEREFHRRSITLAAFQADFHKDDANSGTRSGLLPMYEGCRPERQNLVALITESLENEVRLLQAACIGILTGWETIGLGACSGRWR